MFKLDIVVSGVGGVGGGYTETGRGFILWSRGKEMLVIVGLLFDSGN